MFLYRLFPPPKYLSMPSFGLDISDRSLKYMSLKKEDGKIRIDKFGKKVIPEGIISSGIIKKQDEFISFLKNSSNKEDIKYAVVALPEEKAFLHTTQLPNIDPNEIRGALEVQMEEHVPLPPDQVVFDYKTIGLSPDKKHIDVVLAAYPKNIVEDYYNVFKKAGIQPIAFEIEAQSIARAVIPKNNKEVLMIIDFGKTRTSFIIVSGQDLRYTSTIDVAGEEVDKAISKVLGVDIYEAERIKKSEGRVFNAEKDNRIYKALLPLVSVIKEEAERNFTFWDTHSQHVHLQKDREIKKIILCGGDSNLGGLREYLSYALKIDTEMANAWVNVASFEEYIPEIDFSSSLIYTTTIGLALRALQN